MSFFLGGERKISVPLGCRGAEAGRTLQIPSPLFLWRDLPASPHSAQWSHCGAPASPAPLLTGLPPRFFVHRTRASAVGAWRRRDFLTHLGRFACASRCANRLFVKPVAEIAPQERFLLAAARPRLQVPSILKTPRKKDTVRCPFFLAENGTTTHQTTH